jgi:ribonuclease P protein component
MRMRQSADFARAVRRGRSAGRPSLIVHLWVDGADADTGVKVGFIVSKQVGTAVQRHQVTRRLRHLTAARVDRLPEPSLMVVRARAGAAERTFGELGRDLDRALDRLVGDAR